MYPQIEVKMHDNWQVTITLCKHVTASLKNVRA